MKPDRAQRLIVLAIVVALLFTLAAPKAVSAAPLSDPASQGAPPVKKSEWLVMLYQNADDEVLEGDIYTDLNEAELVGSTRDVTIVSQFDRYDGAFDGDGDWTAAKRFLVTQDDDLTAVNSVELEGLGEIDSGAPETLADFLIWAISAYPAKKHALILSDHGAGWLGGWNDNAPEEGSTLSINEIDQALATALAETGLARLEFIGFDACLMSQVEALSGVAPYARYAVASEEVEPAMGWAYAEFLDALVKKPSQTGADLAKSIVSSYIVDDVRIQDDDARAEFIVEATGVEQEIPPEQLAEEMSNDVTLTALNLQMMSAYMSALNDFALALTAVDPTAIAQARTYAQSFENVFGKEVPPPYLDVGNFAKLVAELAESRELNTALKALQTAAKKFILAEKHGPARPGATGLTIFFPVADLLVGVGVAESEISYTAYASRFAGASLWDDFLAFYYTNRDFDPDLADVSLLDARTGQTADIEVYAAPLLEDVSQEGDAVFAPGVESELFIAPIEVSSEEIAAGETVLLGTSIAGGNVGYIYIEAARYDEASDSFSIEDRDFVLADDTEEIDGVAYPVWRETDLEDFIFEWSPTVYTLSDGETEAFILLDPAVYGGDGGDSEYDVYGLYTFADSGEKREAVMTYDGNLEFVSVYGFTGNGGTGAPREITPQAGDQFTVYEEWIEADVDGSEIRNWYLGDTLTFNGEPFTVAAYDAYPGVYSVAITVQDLNGNEISEYATVMVTE